MEYGNIVLLLCFLIIVISWIGAENIYPTDCTLMVRIVCNDTAEPITLTIFVV